MTWMKREGGSNLYDFVSNVLTKVAGKEILAKFNRTGGNGKQKLSTHLVQIIEGQSEREREREGGRGKREINI